MSHPRTLALLLFTAAAPILAQPSTRAATASDELQCGFTRKDAPDYVMWICNASGTELSPDGVILWTRKSDAGADVISTVWTGRVADLPKRAKTIIAEHRRQQAGCSRYVHVAHPTPDGMDWNMANVSARRTIEDLRSAHPGLCYAAHPATSDFVLAWGEPRLMPSAFTIQVPKQLPARDHHDTAPSGPEFIAGDVPNVAMYRVVPGVDGTVLRLGVAVYESGELAPGVSASATAFGKALAAVVPAK